MYAKAPGTAKSPGGRYAATLSPCGRSEGSSRCAGMSLPYGADQLKLMTPENFSATREAPPIRPPSISGWAIRSWAFLSFMEPP